MLPHEKTLVERLKNEPFALIGINTDEDKDEYRKKAEEQNVTWRSAWDGSTKGPLCTAWGVSSFPTIYVLDGKGVLRYMGVRNEKMTEAVDTLLAEMKGGASKDPRGAGKDARADEKSARDGRAGKADESDKPAPQEPAAPIGLKVGMRAPDFTTKDASGVEFALSDYRGKVVVLDFWGFW